MDTLTEALCNQFEKPRMVDITGTINRVQVWQCKRCLKEINFSWCHPSGALTAWHQDRGRELRDHLDLDCHVEVCDCGHMEREHYRTTGWSPSGCDICRCVRYVG